MKFGIVLLSLLSFANAQKPYTAYADSVQIIQDAKKQLQVMMLSMKDDVPDITDPRRHYAVLVNHFIEVGNAMAWNCSAVYEEIYMELLTSSITTGLTDVQYVIGSIEQKLKSFEDKLEMIETLINTMCPKTERNAICNHVVDQIVRGDPMRYNHSANVLLAGGVMAIQFLDTYLIPVAYDYAEVAYLINHMDDLKDLIAAVADRIKLDQRLCGEVRL